MFVGALLAVASASAATDPAAQAPFRAQIIAVAYTYDPGHLLRVMVHNDQAQAHIDALEAEGGWRWMTGCAGNTLDHDAACVATLQRMNGVADATPAQLRLALTVDGRKTVANLPVHRMGSPYALESIDQKFDAGDARSAPNVVYLPATKVGERGDSVEVRIEALHFAPLELRVLHAPGYIELGGDCVGKRLPSPLVEDDAQARQCRLILRFNPTDAAQSDGELNTVLSDGVREYPLDLQLRARPWQPLYARKVGVVEGHLYVLLRDGSLWSDARRGGWMQVAAGVDDFFAGPDQGLVIRQGEVIRARGDGYRNRFGSGLDTDWDASIGEFPWVALPVAARTVYVAKEATYAWDQDGRLWEAGRRHLYWNGKGPYPGDDESPRQVSHRFVHLYQDEDAVFGIDAQSRLWMRGEFYDRDAHNVGVPVHAADWVLRESGVAQYASCGGDELKLDLAGNLYARGGNYLGKLGAGEKINLIRWTQVNTGVRAFTIDCSRLGVPHSFRSLYALKQDGTLWGVGNNRHGQLGLAPETAEYSTQWRLVAQDVASFEANEFTLLMLKSDGSVWASGSHDADITQRTYRGRLGAVAPLGDFR